MKRSRRGYLSVEVLVYVSILSLITTILFEAFNVGSANWNMTYTQLKLEKELRRGMDRMTRELRNSNLNRITIPQSNVLQFQVPTSVSSNGTITWSGWIQYSLGGINNRQLLRTDLSTNQTTSLANHVSGIQFVSHTDPATLSIMLTGQDTTVGGRVATVTLPGAVDFRN